MEQAKRFNDGKPRYGLLPWWLLEGWVEKHSITPKDLEPLVRVMEFGAKKYGDFNWMKGFPPEKTMDSLMRHYLLGVKSGEDFDAESGQPHLAHILWNLMSLLYALRNRDDKLPDARKLSPMKRSNGLLMTLQKLVAKDRWVGVVGLRIIYQAMAVCVHQLRELNAKMEVPAKEGG